MDETTITTDKTTALAIASIACGVVDGSIVGLLSRSKVLGCVFGILSALGMGMALCVVSQGAGECKVSNCNEWPGEHDGGELD